jgi:cyclic beta-1,2-glucan synthetase
LAGLLPLVMPLITDLLAGLLNIGRVRGTGGFSWQAVRSFRDSFLRILLAVAFIPYEALLGINAIGVTLWRMGVTRRQLLRWTTSAQTERLFERNNGRIGIWLEMIAAPISALSLALLLFIFRPGSLAVAAPLLALWLFAPEIAYWISRPTRAEAEPLTESDRSRLHRLASRTWLFFEQFVGPEDHWLPPDHYQEFPLGILAHRTSPTNIGLNLLTILGAYDLGYIGLLSLSARLRNSFDTLDKMERYRGHFLNWYDTRTLEPLEPSYISTVDSGNLAGCLIALGQGLQDLSTAPVLRWEIFQGLLDALALLSEHLDNLEDCAIPLSIEEPRAVIDDLVEQIRLVEGRPHDWPLLLARLSSPKSPRQPGWSELDQTLLSFVEECAEALDTESVRRLRLYTQSVRQRLDNALREVDLLHPWISALSQPPALFSQPEDFPGLSAAWNKLVEVFTGQCGIGRIREVASAGQAALATIIDDLMRLDQSSAYGAPAQRIAAALDWSRSLRTALGSAAEAGEMLLAEFQALASEAESYVREMDFQFLFDPDRKVLHIGYNRTLGRLDPNYYDLLASEARIASLVAIAKGEVPVSHWLHLGRPLNNVDGRPVLLSWSATMFEYLMPLLFVRNYRGTLLEQSAFSATDIQIEYGRSKGTPWGISESGYYRFDPFQAYQYRAFGVPGLGFKRGLGDDLVITPYASLLALPLRPGAVLQNLTSLEDLGAQGAFGFYEAVDFTSERLSLGKRYELVREYMAHHQAMIFLSLANFFQDDRTTTG